MYLAGLGAGGEGGLTEQTGIPLYSKVTKWNFIDSESESWFQNEFMILVFLGFSVLFLKDY